MKKWVLFIVSIGLALSTFSISAIDDTDTGIYQMAEYFPHNSLGYIAFRTDEAFIDQLEPLVQTLTQSLDEFGIPPVGLRGAVLLLGFDLQQMTPWLGDTAAIGGGNPAEVADANMNGATPRSFYTVAQVRDAAGAADYLENELGFIREDRNEQAVYIDPTQAFQIVITDEVLVISTVNDSVRTSKLTNSLAASESFQQVLAEMPAAHYHIFGYANPTAYFDAVAAMFAATPPQLQDILAIGRMGLGFTILNDESLVVDMALLPPNGIFSFLQASSNSLFLMPFSALALSQYTPPVNSEFLRHVPADMAVVMHGAGLASAVSEIIAVLDELAALDGQPQGFSMQIEAILAQFGMDLQADILSWSGSDYAIVGRLDTLAVMRDALAFDLNLDNRFDIGLVMDTAQNPAGGQQLIEKLTTLLQAGTIPELTVGQDTINGISVTTLQLDIEFTNPLIQVGCIDEAPPQEQFSAEFILGANDELLVLANRALATQIFGGESPSVTTTEPYEQATDYLLPDANNVWVTSGEGFLTGTVFNPITVLTLLGPQIGCVFDNIVTSLQGTPEAEGSPTPIPTATPIPTPDGADIEQQVAAVNYYIDLIEQSTFSSTITESGATIARFSVTLAR